MVSIVTTASIINIPLERREESRSDTIVLKTNIQDSGTGSGRPSGAFILLSISSEEPDAPPFAPPPRQCGAPSESRSSQLLF